MFGRTLCKNVGVLMLTDIWRVLKGFSFLFMQEGLSLSLERWSILKIAPFQILDGTLKLATQTSNCIKHKRYIEITLP